MSERTIKEQLAATTAATTAATAAATAAQVASEAVKVAQDVASRASDTAEKVAEMATKTSEAVLVFGQDITYIKKDVAEIKIDLKEINTKFITQQQHQELVNSNTDHENRIRSNETNITKIMTWGSVGIVFVGILEFIVQSFLRQ